MPTDSGHSFNITNEAEDTLPTVQGDTPELDQGLVTLGVLEGSAYLAITPIADPITPIPDPITPLPEVEDSTFITDLSDVLATYDGKEGEGERGHPAPRQGTSSPAPLKSALSGDSPASLISTPDGDTSVPTQELPSLSTDTLLNDSYPAQGLSSLGGRPQDSPNGPPTGDHEGPPYPTSTSLAPTDGDGLFLRLTPTGQTQGSHLLYTVEMADLQALLVGAPHSTLLVDAVRKRRLRKIMLRRYSRQQLRAARVRERRATRRLGITITGTVLALLVVLLSVGSTAGYVGYRFVHQTEITYQQQVVTLRDLLPIDNLKMYDSKGVLIDQLTDNGIHTTVTFNQIAPIMQDATVATEDKNFWSNLGVDVVGITRALLTNLSDGRVVEGGSTITQQLIKNLIVGNQPTVVRKLEEIILAPQVNNDYTKQDILTMYLNSIYYGNQAYGIDAAASVYFGLQDKPGHSAASQLDIAQSAILAGLPSNPTFFDPLAHPQTAMKRITTVLDLMVAQRYISTADKYDAIHEEQGKNFFKTAAALQNRAPHFANYVVAQLQKMFHMKNRSDLSRSGMVVYTTLDISLQDKIQKIMQQHIAELRAAHNITNAAEVLIDFHTGAITSMLGSIDYNNASIDGQFDVTQAYRQPGSSFKPYVYVTAFQQGASPAQAIDDQPISIQVPDSNPSMFTPTNYDNKFHGHMTLRCALQNSLNVPGVKVLQHVGINNAMQTAYNMGITSYEGTPGYSLVLGGLGIRLIDHTSAMGVFANGGVRVPEYAINKVFSGNTGALLYQHQLDAGTQVISPQLAYMMTNVLSDNADRTPEFYDCNVLQLYANSQQDCWNGNRGVVRPAAAKTGTTNDFRDNWTVGYTTDYVMGVWAGNDNNSPMIDVSGISGAAPIWHDSMLVAEQGHPIQNFTNPGGLVRATLTYPDGVKTTDLFLPGTVPTFAEASTPTSGVGNTPPPGAGGDPSQPLSAAYCPASYSFAFAPPSENEVVVDAGWW